MQRNYNRISIPTWASGKEPTPLHFIYTKYIVSERSQFQGYMTTTAFENNRIPPGRIFFTPCPEAIIPVHSSPAGGVVAFSSIYANGCPRTQSDSIQLSHAQLSQHSQLDLLKCAHCKERPVVCQVRPACCGCAYGFHQCNVKGI